MRVLTKPSRSLFKSRLLLTLGLAQRERGKDTSAMIRKLFSILGKVGPYLVAFAIGVIVVHTGFKSRFVTPVQPGSAEKVFFEIPQKANMDSISRNLEERGLLRHWYSVYLLSKLKGEEKLNILAGEYELSPGMTPSQILNHLLSRQIVQHGITIPEGVNVFDVIQIIGRSGLVTEEDVRRVVSDRTLMVKLDIPALTPEGFLAPETLQFSKPVTAEQIVTRFVEEGKKRIDDRLKDWKARAKELGFTPYQAIILASVVEKESAKPEERTIVSSVFHNRLRIGMPLQSDPTVIYGLMPNFSGNITKDDLKRPGPYNTYLNTGLPPTPIANPSPEAIHAVLYPDDTDFLYFVAKGDGSHHFSATYKEHQAAVQNFQRGR